MAEMKQSATQRIQVGVLGILIVLLFVSLANMALERANDQPAHPESQAAMPSDIATQEKGTAAGEPLAELGVTPVAKESPEPPGIPDAGAANVKTSPAKPE